MRSEEEIIHSIELGVEGGGQLYLKILVSFPDPFGFWALGFEALGGWGQGLIIYNMIWINLYFCTMNFELCCIPFYFCMYVY